MFKKPYAYTDSKIHVFGIIFFALLMVLMIAALLIFTGGKPLSEYEDYESGILGLFIMVESCLGLGLMYNIIRRDEVAPSFLRRKDKRYQTYYEKVHKRRGIILLICGVALSCALAWLGNIAAKQLPSLRCIAAYAALAICSLLPILFVILNYILRKQYRKKYNDKSFAERREFLLSHRDSAEETAKGKLAFLRRVKLLSHLYACAIALIAAACAFLGGTLGNAGGIIFGIYASFLMLTALSRIVFPSSDIFYQEEYHVLPERGYPELYKMAHTAADKLGCRLKFRIAIVGEDNVSIIKEKNFYIVMIGIFELLIHTKEEMFNIFLHEFAHVSKVNEGINSESLYFTKISNKSEYFFSPLTRRFFLLPDTVYKHHFKLYRYAAAIDNETACDRAMRDHGDVNAAAAMLVKSKYYELFCWEEGAKDEDPFFGPEKFNPDYIKSRSASFFSAVEEKKEFWNELLAKEIISQDSTHPTVIMRLEALGADGYPFNIPDHESDADKYQEEVENAHTYLIKQFDFYYKYNYARHRKENYLEPLGRVEEWENEGKPVIAEKYADMFNELLKLGRKEDAHTLCLRAIEELTSPADSFALLMHGLYRLYTYNSDGISFIYRAAEGNPNISKDAVSYIERYCCLVGDQDELDRVGKNLLKVGQDNLDKYSKLATLTKKDKISEEHLPEDILSGFLEFVRSLEDSKIEHIYIVRKTITDDFFTSAVVVYYIPGTPFEKREEVFHKLYRYLDTSTEWQFSLFDYKDVAKLGIAKIPNSLVYKAKKE